jgi:hypothetical protein
MPFWPEMQSDAIVYCEKALGLPKELEPSPPALALPGRLVRVFRPVLEITTLVRNHARQHHLLRGSLATEFVCDEDTRFSFRRASQLPKEQDRGPPVPFGLGPECR